MGGADPGLCRRNHQQGDVFLVFQRFVFLKPGDVVVAPHAGIDDRIRDGLDHVSVIVGTAQTFRRQYVGIHHDHIGKLVEIVVAHIVLVVEERKLDLLVAGDMRIAQEGAYLLPGIDRAGGVDRAAGEMTGVCKRRRKKCPLPLGAHLFEIQQHDQEIQQVAGQVAVVPGHDEPSHGVVFHDALR